VFGLLMRHWSWPLAIMLSADRVDATDSRAVVKFPAQHEAINPGRSMLLRAEG
jgi:hypothetical protein